MNSTVLKSEPRTASATSEDQRQGAYSSAMIFLNITEVPEEEAAVLKLHIDGKDPASGEYFPDLFGIIETTAAEAQRIFTTGGNSPMPQVWRARVETEDGEEWTYSVGASPIA